MDKQYLLMVNEDAMKRFNSVYGNYMQFLEVQGMEVTDNKNFKILVSPVPQEEPAAEPVADIAAEPIPDGEIPC